MLFSIVIPTYNNFPQLKKCLDSLEKLTLQDFEALICIDGSTDETEASLQKATYSFPFKVLNHPDKQNKGRSAARNLAFPHLGGEYALFLDSDMIVAPDLLERHQEVMAKDTISLGAVHYHDVGNNAWVRYLSVRGIAKYDDREEVPHNYFITPNTVVPAEMVLGVEGFDEKINRYGGEDMEFGHRIWLKYKPKFIFNAQAKVHTVQDKRLDQALKELREYGGSGLRYITQKFPELSHIYWVDKCNSTTLKDRAFEWLTLPIFQSLVRALLGIIPYPLKNTFISYLVVSAIHDGFRNGIDS